MLRPVRLKTFVRQAFQVFKSLIFQKKIYMPKKTIWKIFNTYIEIYGGVWKHDGYTL